MTKRTLGVFAALSLAAASVTVAALRDRPSSPQRGMPGALSQQEHEGEGNLGDDESITEAVTARPTADILAAFF